MLLSRRTGRRKVPAGARRAVALAQGESVLGAAFSDGSDVLIATDRALTLLAAADTDYSPRWRIRWDEIDNAKWRPPDLVLYLRAGVQDSLPEALVVPVDHRSELPAVVRERVTSSIVVNDEVPVGEHSARVVARRNSDTGDLVWRILLDRELDKDDPTVRAQAERALAELRVVVSR